MFQRSFNPPKNHSFFLFGPRQTGKSTLLGELLKSDDLLINLLPETSYLSYAREPGLFRRQVLAHVKKSPNAMVAVDEVQRLPDLLNEVHDLIETQKIRFVLTGSSARKLKHGASNLLAGRAFTLRLFPLSANELGQAFDLERALCVGTLPLLWAQPEIDSRQFLKSYTDTYLREEIQAEGIVRNIGPFAQFLDIAALNDGELVNYTAIARDCGVSSKTVQSYYQILEDSFVTYKVPAWHQSVRKQLVNHARYYFFDTGITNALCHTLGTLNAEIRGRRFEQWVVSQTIAAMQALDINMAHWRTRDGAEVDLLLYRGRHVLAAVEIKSSTTLRASDTSGLKRFAEEYPQVPRFLVTNLDRPQILEDGIEVIHWLEWINEQLVDLGS
jgi:uncharacterized protein